MMKKLLGMGVLLLALAACSPGGGGGAEPPAFPPDQGDGSMPLPATAPQTTIAGPPTPLVGPPPPTPGGAGPTGGVTDDVIGIPSPGIPSHCGNQVCDADETPGNCPKDCPGLAGGAQSPETPPVCGDGACDGNETAGSCPQDCTTTGGGGGAKKKTYQPCQSDADCISGTCLFVASKGAKACVKPKGIVAIGGSCFVDEECMPQSGTAANYCVDGICTATPKLIADGGKCTTDEECQNKKCIIGLCGGLAITIIPPPSPSWWSNLVTGGIAITTLPPLKTLPPAGESLKTLEGKVQSECKAENFKDDHCFKRCLATSIHQKCDGYKLDELGQCVVPYVAGKTTCVLVNEKGQCMKVTPEGLPGCLRDECVVSLGTNLKVLGTAPFEDDEDRFLCSALTGNLTQQAKAAMSPLLNASPSTWQAKVQELCDKLPQENVSVCRRAVAMAWCKWNTMCMKSKGFQDEEIKGFIAQAAQKALPAEMAPYMDMDDSVTSKSMLPPDGGIPHSFGSGWTVPEKKEAKAAGKKLNETPVCNLPQGDPSPDIYAGTMVSNAFVASGDVVENIKFRCIHLYYKKSNAQLPPGYPEKSHTYYLTSVSAGDSAYIKPLTPQPDPNDPDVKKTNHWVAPTSSTPPVVTPVITGFEVDKGNWENTPVMGRIRFRYRRLYAKPPSSDAALYNTLDDTVAYTDVAGGGHNPDGENHPFSPPLDYQFDCPLHFGVVKVRAGYGDRITSMGMTCARWVVPGEVVLPKAQVALDKVNYEMQIGNVTYDKFGKISEAKWGTWADQPDTICSANPNDGTVRMITAVEVASDFFSYFGYFINNLRFRCASPQEIIAQQEILGKWVRPDGGKLNGVTVPAGSLPHYLEPYVLTGVIPLTDKPDGSHLLVDEIIFRFQQLQSDGSLGTPEYWKVGRPDKLATFVSTQLKTLDAYQGMPAALCPPDSVATSSFGTSGKGSITSLGLICRGLK